ncbi:Conserved TM helix [Catalinimonas alkaloidigena]|uniref:Conserved TM helix n=1 Tax=Catalinimonas alkaloidigena TaxID=1075417 RepID=A0A1G9DEL1_9BACT|nr:mechanosensitive ion channel [Catalinimonas alkaloidigena]SDK62331.1 Conserved TM helix [Catalinimonas alkaloidigena]
MQEAQVEEAQVEEAQVNVNEAINGVWDKVTGWVEKIIIMLPNLVVAILIFLIFYFLGRLVRRIVDKPLHRLTHSRAIADLMVNLIFIGLVALGIFIALTVLQLQGAVTSLLAGAGIIGLALGFAFQDIAANFMAGMLMAVRRPIRVGDIIKSNDFFGTVMQINLRDTVIRTFQGQIVYLPNKDVYGSAIENYTMEERRRVDLDVGVSYGDDLRKVREITIKAIESLDMIDKEAGVTLFFKEFGDSSINFTVRYWVSFHKQPEYLTALSEGIIAIKEAYDANDIMIPFPIRTLDFGIKGGEKLWDNPLVLENGQDQGGH